MEQRPTKNSFILFPFVNIKRQPFVNRTLGGCLILDKLGVKVFEMEMWELFGLLV